MKRILICAAAAIVFTTLVQFANAQNQYGISLKPGERLVSVDGVAVSGQQNTTFNTMAPTQTYYNGNQFGVYQQPQNFGYNSGSNFGGSMYGGSDQARAQAEANYMAQNGIRGHVGGTIGRFEGVGWSTSGMPNTCTPGSAMTLTADAVAHGPGGVYRVRAWR